MFFFFKTKHNRTQENITLFKHEIFFFVRSQGFVFLTPSYSAGFFSYFRWLLLFIKVRSGPQTPMAVTGSNDYVRSNACAPRQQRRTFHYQAVLSGRYLLYHMGYACHQYRSAASQISLSTLWNSHRGIVKKIYWRRKKRNSLNEQSNTWTIHTKFWTLWCCVVLKNKTKQSVETAIFTWVSKNVQPAGLHSAKWLNLFELNRFG